MKSPIEHLKTIFPAMLAVMILWEHCLLAGTQLPRIMTSPGPDGCRFTAVDSTGSRTFMPIGNSLVLLAGPEKTPDHALFSRGFYDPGRMDRTLTDMSAKGYTVVRVFIFKGRIFVRHIIEPVVILTNSTGELNSVYMSNFFDFLDRARDHWLHVQVVLDGYPDSAYYLSLATNGSPDVDPMNREDMAAGAIEAKRQYIERVVRAVKDRGHLQTVFCWEISNEPSFSTEQKPFSMSRGVVGTAAGIFDMSLPNSRQACADANFSNSFCTGRKAVRSVDPQALVSVSVFSHGAVRKAGLETAGLLPIDMKNKLWPPRFRLLYAWLDVVDFHAYISKSNPATPRQILEELDFAQIAERAVKPTILGEFGTHRKEQPNTITAAQELHAWRQDFLDAGFAGANLFTWDTTNMSRVTAIEDGGIVGDRLSPIAGK
ncbi:MAG: hypothetical protein AABZ39_14545 [Spirochaetota bacterium]